MYTDDLSSNHGRSIDTGYMRRFYEMDNPRPYNRQQSDVSSQFNRQMSDLSGQSFGLSDYLADPDREIRRDRANAAMVNLEQQENGRLAPSFVHAPEESFGYAVGSGALYAAGYLLSTLAQPVIDTENFLRANLQMFEQHRDPEGLRRQIDATYPLPPPFGGNYRNNRERKNQLIFQVIDRARRARPPAPGGRFDRPYKKKKTRSKFTFIK